MVKFKAEINVPLALFFIVVLLIIVSTIAAFWNKILIGQMKNQFRFVYGDYTSALSQTVSDFNGETHCYLSSDKAYYRTDVTGCEAFFKQFVKNVDGLNQYCPDYAQDRGCIPMYKKYTEKPKCAGFSENMMNKFSKGFKYNNSSSMSLFNMPTSVINPIFAFDINGAAEPNKAGYDLFALVVMRNSTGYYFHPNIGYCMPVDRNGMQNLKDIYK